MSQNAPAERIGILARFFGIASRYSARYPHAVVALAIFATGVSLVYSMTSLGFKTSRLDLLNPDSDYNRHWMEYINEFGEDDDAVVVVEGPGREEVVPVLEEISKQLAKEDRLFHAVLHEVDLGAIRGKGLHYLSPDDLLALEKFLQEAAGIVDGDWSRLSIGNMFRGMSMQMEAMARQGMQPGAIPPGVDPSVAAAAARAQGGGQEPPDLSKMLATDRAADLERLVAGLNVALGQRNGYQSPWPEMPASFATLSELSSEYLLTKEGKLGFVLLRLARGDDSFSRGSEATDALRKLLNQVRARYPGVNIGLTGLPIMENDEMRSSEASMAWASILSFAGVMLLFIAGFGGVRYAILSNLVLLMGTIWSFAFAALFVGHLNILSVSFTVMLIGLGIDYGIHYVARYLRHCREGMSCEDALVAASEGVSPGISTGAVTTAVAFFAAGFTDFKGVSELGIIAGGGIMLCAAAELLVLPAAIALFDREQKHKIPSPLPVHLGIGLFVKTPRFCLAMALGVVALMSFGMKGLRYDHNLLNMQPEGLESVAWEKKLLAESDQSMWYALSIADTREDLLEMKERFQKLDSVARVEEIASMLPVEHEVKQPIIERIQQRLATLPERPPLIAVDRPDDLGRVMGQFQEMLAHTGGVSRAGTQMGQVRDSLRKLPISVCYERLSNFQQEMAGDLLSRLHTLRSMANPEPPKLTDLPPSLVDRFVGQHGRHLLKIYGKGNIWDMQALKRFVDEVRTVDTCCTGNPLQAYEASLDMKRSYEEAAVYALLVIMVVLYLDFRSVKFSILAAMPLAMGMLMMFGIMGLLNIPLNPANMIALPLVMGIGIDCGVHVVHDYLEQKGRYRMSAAIAIAILLDGATTGLGFGSLMIASHQGLQSLGRALAIGITACMLSAFCVLPPVLALMSWNRGKKADGSDEDESSDPDDRRETASAPQREYLRFDSPHVRLSEPHIGHTTREPLPVRRI